MLQSLLHIVCCISFFKEVKQVLKCLSFTDVVDIAKLLFELSVTVLGKHKNDESVSHALKVREAVAFKNYHTFFKLCKSAPNCGKFFMNKLAVELRKGALQAISKA